MQYWNIVLCYFMKGTISVSLLKRRYIFQTLCSSRIKKIYSFKNKNLFVMLGSAILWSHTHCWNVWTTQSASIYLILDSTMSYSTMSSVYILVVGQNPYSWSVFCRHNFAVWQVLSNLMTMAWERVLPWMSSAWNSTRTQIMSVACDNIVISNIVWKMSIL